MNEELTPDLLALLGESAFVALAQTFGGRRLYLPKVVSADHELAQAIGETAAIRLCKRYCPAFISVPLAREVRARHYRAAGKSYGQIASLLGMTESGAWKLLRRMDQPPVKGSAIADQPQGDLFS